MLLKVYVYDVPAASNLSSCCAIDSVSCLAPLKKEAETFEAKRFKANKTKATVFILSVVEVDERQ